MMEARRSLSVRVSGGRILPYDFIFYKLINLNLTDYKWIVPLAISKKCLRVNWATKRTQWHKITLSWLIFRPTIRTVEHIFKTYCILVKTRKSNNLPKETSTDKVYTPHRHWPIVLNVLPHQKKKNKPKKRRKSNVVLSSSSSSLVC